MHQPQSSTLDNVEPFLTEKHHLQQHVHNRQNDDKVKTHKHHNTSMSLHEHSSDSLGNQVLPANIKQASNTSLDVSDDERPHLTNSNGINNHDVQTTSDSQSVKSSERTTTKKVKKQKKKSRIGQIIAGVSHRSKSELFHKLSKNMAPEEVLISDYSCALQRDILVHGRLYLSQTWLCFYANIFGWETLVTIKWTDITAITKEKTAKLIPNAIQILTGTDKLFFSTFVAREVSYTVLFRIWQNALLGQPMLPDDLRNICKRKATSGGEIRDEGSAVTDDHVETGDEMVEAEENKSFNSTCEPMESDISKNGGKREQTIGGIGPHCETSDDIPYTDTSTSSKHQLHTSYIPYSMEEANGEGETTTDNDDSEDDQLLTDHVDNVLCPCHDNHVGKEYADEEFNFDVDALYEHLFSQESDMMKTVFAQQKFKNTKYTPYQEEADGSHSQVLTYDIPLNYSIGPKQCKTINKHYMSKENTPGSFYVIKTESTTPGVPYGDSFQVSTQYCITRASGNRSRLRITSTTVYTKRVFGPVKSIISRGSDDGVKGYTNFLMDILKSESDLLSYQNVSQPKPKLEKSKSIESSKHNYPQTPAKKLIDDVEDLFTSREEGESKSNEVINNNSHLSRFAVVFCLIFLLTNVYMLSRLRSLERSVLVNKDQWVLPDQLRWSTAEDCNNLLHYQESLHELKLIKLKEVVGSTATLLEQVQLSLRMLYNSIERNIDDLHKTKKEKQSFSE